MRRAGPTLAASVFAAAVAAAQPPAAPPQPPAPQPAPADPPNAPHLDGWERTMGQLVNFSAEFDKVVTDPVFKKERTYTGSVLCMKPNFALLRVESQTNKGDYEAYVCNGKSVFQYEGAKKTVTEIKLGQAGGNDDLMLSFLGGMKAAAARERFDFQLVKQDENYVVLQVVPKFGKDKQEFTEARMALFAPTNVAKLPAYLPAQVWRQHPNGDTELWKLRKHATNSPGVDAKLFQYQPIPGWQLQQAPQGAPAVPTGAPRP